METTLTYEQFVGPQANNDCPRYDNFYCDFAEGGLGFPVEHIRILQSQQFSLAEGLISGITDLTRRRDSDPSTNFLGEMKKMEPELYRAYVYLRKRGFLNHDLGVVVEDLK